MKILFRFLVLMIMISSLNNYHATAQDTIHVQCFFYGYSQDSSIVFPSDTVRFQKIIMNYKLRCPFTAQCGEWDYLAYTYLYQPTGKFDSVAHPVVSYIANGSSPDSIQFMTSPSFSYHPFFERYIVNSSTISFDSSIIAGNNLSMNHPFNASMPVCRSQYLWKSSELISSGLTAGNITGLRLNLQSTGSAMRHLIIRIKNTTLDSITTAGFEQTGFTTVFDRNTTFSSTGWNTISFTNNFNWNGSSNLVFDISFSNDESGTPAVISGSNSGFSSGITTGGEDRSLFFEGADYVDVPYHAFDDLDSAITISFWAFGNPAFQPQNQSVFEGLTNSNQRVLNCHLPWGDGTVYWDAGNSGGSYDRTSIAVTSADYEGNWVYWTFTKNIATGRLKIYKNGVLVRQANSMTKLMSGIRKFKVGANGLGANSYDGYIDDFEIFNKEIDITTINKWMYKKIDSTHPYYSNLILYYSFNTKSNNSTADSSVGNHNGTLLGIPESKLYTPDGIFKNFENTTERPDVIFEKGVYTSTVDSALLVDSTELAPVSIVYYDTSNSNMIPVDTQVVYPAYYNQYVYDSNGHAVDSSFVTPDSTIHLVRVTYWDPPFEVTNRFELGRYVTPYGNGLDLGNGFNWVYDVSDFRTLLHDTVHLKSTNGSELVDLSFDMIKGIPPRDPISIENVYPGGSFTYGLASNPIESHFPPKKVAIEPAALNTRIKYCVTGHGEDGNNCDEFCAKYQYINVDGTQRFSQLVWKDDCSLNPLYPQGGTWLYQRANWCPGDDVPPFDYELTPYVTPGDSAIIDVNFEPYTLILSTSGNSYPACVVETQLVKYGAPNFTLDASVAEIKSPSDKQIYQRHNPICNNPLITIQNTGSTVLTSLTITYGQVGGTQSTFNWTGHLDFLQKQDVQLGNVIWDANTHQFHATVSNPNGSTDQYSGNNTMSSSFVIPPVFDNDLIIELKTNNQASENSYTLKNDLGVVVHSRSGLGNNVTYADHVTLPEGCYELRLTDSGEDGLTWWANTPGGSGYIQIKRASDNTVLKNFNSDFGSEIYLQFTVGYIVGINDFVSDNDIRIYPNPSTGLINFDLNFGNRQNATIEIFGITGNKIYSEKTGNIFSKNITADLSAQPSGIYMVNIKTDDRVYHSKIVLTK